MSQILQVFARLPPGNMSYIGNILLYLPRKSCIMEQESMIRRRCETDDNLFCINVVLVPTVTGAIHAENYCVVKTDGNTLLEGNEAGNNGGEQPVFVNCRSLRKMQAAFKVFAPCKYRNVREMQGTFLVFVQIAVLSGKCEERFRCSF